MTRLKTIMTIAVMTCFATGVAVADAKVFNDGAANGLYRDANNWATVGIPNLGGGGVNGPDTATIGGTHAVIYDSTVPAGADFTVNSTFNLQDSATWTQTGGIQWIQIGQGAGGVGTMNLSGSSIFDAGTAGNFLLGAFGGSSTLTMTDSAQLIVNSGMEVSNTTINMSGSSSLSAPGGVVVNQGSDVVFGGGSFELQQYMNFDASSMSIHGGDVQVGVTSGNWEFANASTFYMDGGTAKLGPGAGNGEFKLYLSNGTLAGGSLDVGFLALFSSGIGDGILDVSGGTLSFDGSRAFDGFYQGGADAYVNLVPGSSGTVVVQNALVADVYTNFIDSAAARIRADGDWLNASSLQLSQVGADTYITLVPEPASLVLLGLGGLTLLRRRR
ncbi:MAG: PEP-CTERM sorting domain-containing protein [Phycisphaerales bacterium]|nr:PEP-CTERM sorting domain-containing protein [Phycisphaerales bacterium]